MVDLVSANYKSTLVIELRLWVYFLPLSLLLTANLGNLTSSSVIFLLAKST